MVIEFIVAEGIIADIFEIIDWYNSKRPGLGERFYNELLNEFESIKRSPLKYAYYSKDFRRAVLKHFPYLLIFTATEKAIVIYLVIYGGRNPELINKKIN